jgi:phosphoribosylformylglycinamidine cyclo-ligase
MNILKNLLRQRTFYQMFVEKLVAKDLIKAAAHITGGGIAGNLSRSIPEDFCASVSKENIPKQELFEELKNLIGEEEAYKTFNMGVGFCVIAGEENCSEIVEIAAEFEPFMFGRVKKAVGNEEKSSRICFR